MIADLLLFKVAVFFGSVFIFPAVAVFLRHRPDLFWLTTAIWLSFIALFAVVAGNGFVVNDADRHLWNEYGFGHTIPRSLLLYGLSLGLPSVAATLAIQALAGRLSSRLGLYVISVLSAVAASVLGGRVAMYALGAAA